MKIEVNYIPQEDEFVDISVWFDDGAVHLGWKPF